MLGFLKIGGHLLHRDSRVPEALPHSRTDYRWPESWEYRGISEHHPTPTTWTAKSINPWTWVSPNRLALSFQWSTILRVHLKHSQGICDGPKWGDLLSFLETWGITWWSPEKVLTPYSIALYPPPLWSWGHRWSSHSTRQQQTVGGVTLRLFQRLF